MRHDTKYLHASTEYSGLVVMNARKHPSPARVGPVCLSQERDATYALMSHSFGRYCLCQPFRRSWVWKEERSGIRRPSYAGHALPLGMKGDTSDKVVARGEESQEISFGH